jgi:hypothetical protein
VSNPADHLIISTILHNQLSSSVAWSRVIENEQAEGRNGRCDLSFFPVDNVQGMEDKTLQKMLKCIESVLDKEPYVHAHVPLTWFQALDMMQGNKESYRQYGDVEKTCNSLNIVGEDVKTMLHFFHEMGVLMWHAESNLQDIVILNPIEYFVTPATLLICKHEPDEKDGIYHSKAVHKKARKEYKMEWDEMVKEGQIHQVIIDAVLEEYSVDHRKIVIELMKKYGLLVKITSSENASSCLLAPALLPCKAALTMEGCSTFYFMFGTNQLFQKHHITYYVEDCETCGFLPAGLFERLLGKVVSWVQEKSTSDGSMSCEMVSRKVLVLLRGKQRFQISLLQEMNMIEVDVDGEGPLAVHNHMIELIKHVISECMHQLSFFTILPYPANTSLIASSHSTAVDTKKDLMFVKLSEIQAAGKEHQSVNLFAKKKSQVFSVADLMSSYKTWIDMYVSLESYDVFLSYRWLDYDKQLVNDVFEELTNRHTTGGNHRGVRVFLDSYRLPKGDSFQSEFVQGLLHSEVFVPIVSEGTLESMIKKVQEGKEDNVLIEWMMALICKQFVKTCRLQKIFPVLVGKTEKGGDTKCGNLFVGDVLQRLPVTVSKESMEIVTRLLAKKGIEVDSTMSAVLSQYTVKYVVEEIMRNLGLQAWEINQYKLLVTNISTDCLKLVANADEHHKVMLDLSHQIHTNNTSTSLVSSDVDLKTFLTNEMISFDFEIDEINEVYEIMKKKKIRTIKTWKQISVEDFEEIVKEEFQLERVMKSVLLGLHKKVLA